MEDTGWEQRWRLMKQQLPNVSSWQSDLLITHCSGVFFYLTQHANWQNSHYDTYTEEGNVGCHREAYLPLL